MKRLVGILLLAALAFAPAHAQPHALREDLATWERVIGAHEPGTLSREGREIGAWPWTRLKPVLDGVRLRASRTVLLKAASFYLDLAVIVPLDQRPVYPTEGGGTLGKDGQPIGAHTMDSQIRWGRHLVTMALDRFGAGDAEKELASTWLRTVTALFARKLNLADLHPHLTEALRVLPKDAGLIYESGCALETSATPMIQATLRTGRSLSQNRPSVLLSQAESRYRLALRDRPGDREIHVRLGRVLTLRGRHEDAEAALRQAAGLRSDSTVEYYYWLILGDVLTKRTRWDEAATAYRRAAALYPEATGPHLGISRLYSDKGQPAAARRALEPLFSLPPDTAANGDPRWQYDRCTGRNTKDVYDRYVERFREALQ